MSTLLTVLFQLFYITFFSWVFMLFYRFSKTLRDPESDESRRLATFHPTLALWIGRLFQVGIYMVLLVLAINIALQLIDLLNKL